tara:strand:- start:1128 stop:1934 length:807 start_codon:yes stop_codon:yes gene_type:complete
MKIYKNKNIKKNQSRKKNIKKIRSLIKAPINQNYIIWGKHALEAAICNKNRKIINVYHTSEMIGWVSQKLESNDRTKIKLIEVDRKSLDQNSMSSPHQGVLAEVEPINWMSIEECVNQEVGNMCLVLLDQLTNPQNIGSILRTASAFNVAGVVVTKNNTPTENGLMARAAAGAIETMPLIRVTNLSRTIVYLKKNNFFVIGLEKNSNENIKNYSGNKRTAIVLGSENVGLRRLTREKLSVSAKIPIAVQTESLNVSNAAAIALYVIQN